MTRENLTPRSRCAPRTCVPVTQLLLALAAAVAAPSAAANDGFGALGAGGVVLGKTDKIAMSRELLDISCARIQVRYDFVNESDADVTTDISFPLPPYPANQNESGVIAHGQPAAFTVLVEGKPQPFRTRVRAKHQGKDVTASLREIGYDDRQIATFPFDDKLLRQGHEVPDEDPRKSALRRAGLIENDMPTWTIEVAYEWRQTFPARAHLHVEHSYRPFTAEGSASGYLPGANGGRVGAAPLEQFCPAPAQIDQLHRLFDDPTRRDPYGLLPGTIVDYLLTTANTWKDGIRDFTLRLHPEAPDQVVALCFPGRARKLDDGGVEVHIRNFRPRRELHAYIGNLRACRGATSYGEAPAFAPPAPTP